MKLVKYWIKVGLMCVGALYVGGEFGIAACGELLSWLGARVEAVMAGGA